MRGSTSSRRSPNPREIIPTRITFVDIAGLVRGASKGEGLGNQFLANIREVDAIVHVLRCFEDDDITHVEGRIDPVGDADTVETELMLADLESLERRVVPIEKKAKGGDKEAKEQFALMTKALVLLREGKPARAADLHAGRARALSPAGPDDAEAGALCLQCRRRLRPRPATNTPKQVEEKASAKARAAVVISARIEEEVAQLAAGRARGIPGEPRPRRAGPQPADPRGLRAAGPHHLLHRGTEGSARLDRDEGRARAAGGRRHPHRFRERLHPRRDHRL